MSEQSGQESVLRGDIIRMARTACDTDKVDAWHNGFWTLTQEELERFAAIVAAAKEQQMIASGWRHCAQGQRTTQFCGLTEQAIAAEREACAKTVERARLHMDGHLGLTHDTDFIATRITDFLAAHIRARGDA